MKNLADQVDWNKSGGLVPAIVQDSATARVLMLGHMSREALEETLKTGKVTFFSRSKNRLWTKGETSGHFLLLDTIKIDCDNDTLLVSARPQGPACHNGTETCFGEGHEADIGFLGTLENIISARMAADDPGTSYVAKLISKGIDKVAQKVGEEGVETALAGIQTSDENLKNEAADLLFHLMVLLKVRKLSLADVATVLEARHNK